MYTLRPLLQKKQKNNGLLNFVVLISSIMQISEAIALITEAELRSDNPAIWADLGCGSGVFTKALGHLLPAHSHIYAIDKQKQNLDQYLSNKVTIEFIQADFVSERLNLPLLDGVLMANALHYVKDKKKFLERLQTHFKASPSFIIIEYDTMHSNPWVPYPLDEIHLIELFSQLGYEHITKLGERPSRYGQGNMYASYIQMR